MSDWLAGRVVVVTGAGRGIGRACAEALAEAGAHVVCAARTSDEVEAGVASIRSSGGQAVPVAADVSRQDDVERIFAAAEQLGPVTVLVCAAGVLHKALIEDTTDELWDQTLGVNVTGMLRCARRGWAGMRAAGGGRIVTFSSLSGVYATEKFPGLLAYNVSKYGVIGLTEALAVEGKADGIQAVCISPGAVDTKMLREAAPHLKPGLVPADVGRLVAALLHSDMWPLSGANIPLFSNE